MWRRDESVTPPSGRREQAAEAVPVSSPPEKLIMDLGTSLVIKGELSGSEDLTIFGQMEGSISLPDHTLPIGLHATSRQTFPQRPW
jgi:hypothetical protein